MSTVSINQVICGDCLELMPQIANKSIDIILSDLPYGNTQNRWDFAIPCDMLWAQYNRIIKDNGVIALTATQPFASKLIMSNYDNFRYDLVWAKNKPRGFLNSKKMPLRIHESILIFYKKLPTYNPQKTTGHTPVHAYTKHTTDGTNYGATKLGISGGGSTERYPTSILEFKVVNNDSKEKYHATQKPVEMLEWLIKTYTNEGDLVLDSCCGSGSTLIAAKNLKRNYIGMDMDKVFCEISRKRVK